ncbi:XrtA/PEP-CTERM system TPR-repeat protein PrsT [Oleidesulfovibrio sp.]|uniref:XrtA/PEP-CTERM system TPR-repeat protein PrsT n=1 Tax=Oleidesulfovibrio sp. TaxID=2909707 RepID=UPI003A83E2A9
MSFPYYFRTLAVVLVVITLGLSGCSGETSEDFLAEGKKLMEEGNPSGAVVFFKSALEKEPQFYEARLALGKAYVAAGKPEQAETAFQKCLRQNAGDPELRLELARLYVDQRKSREVLEHVNAYEGLAEKTSETEELKGVALAMGGNNPGAEEALVSSITLDPERIPAHIALARLYASMGRLADARKYVGDALKIDPVDYNALLLSAELSRIDGTPEQIIAAFRELAKHYNKDAYARYVIGVQKMKLRDLEGARQTASAMRTEFGDDAYVLMLEGMIAYAANDYETAAQAFQRSVTQRPTLDGFYRLGLAQMNMGDLETALSQFRVVLDRQPRHTEARRMVAATLLRQNRLEDAAAEARRLIENNPDLVWGHFLLASVALAQGNMELAATELDEVTRLDPGMTEAHLQKSYININSGKLDLAQGDLESAVSASPDNLQARVALFQFNMGRGRFDEAEKVLMGGLNNTPRDAVVWSYMARMHLLRRQEDKALAALEKGQQADPDMADNYMAASRVHAAMGRNEEALAQLERYLERKPDSARFVLVSAVLHELLGNSEEVEKRLARAKELGDPDAVPVWYTRLMSKGETDNARTLLEDAYAASKSLRDLSLLSGFYLQQKQVEKAVALYNEYAATDPVAAARGLFTIYTVNKQFDLALEQAKVLEELLPLTPEGALQEAATLERMGQPENALARLDSAYKQYQTPDLLIAQASVAMRMNNIAKAEAFIRTCLKASPDYAPARIAASELAHQQGRLKEAAEGYENVLQRDPNNAIAMNNLSMIYVQDKATVNRALQLALTAYVRQPDRPEVMDTLGLCLTAAGRPAEAVRVLERASTLMPDDPAIRYHFAKALAASGNTEKALQEVKIALGKDEFSEAGEARKLLKRLGG